MDTRTPHLGEEGFRLLFFNHPEPMWVYDLETLAFLEVNEAAVRQYGYTREAFLAMSIREVHPAADVPRLLEHLASGTAGLGEAGTWRHRLQDGRVIDVRVTAHRLDFRGRRAELVMAQDVTEELRLRDALACREADLRSTYDRLNPPLGVTPAALRTTHDRLNLLLGATPTVIYAAKPSGDYGATYVSPNVFAQLGWSAEEFTADSGIWAGGIHPEDRPRVFAELSALSEREHLVHEYRFRHRDGSWRWIHDECRLVRDDGGQPKEIIGYWLDITERKHAEKALRTGEAQLSNALKIARAGHWEYDVANDLFIFNNHFYAIFHTTAEQVGGYTMSFAQYAKRFVHPDDVITVGEEIHKAIESTDPKFTREFEYRIIYADGEMGHTAVRCFTLKDDQGRT